MPESLGQLAGLSTTLAALPARVISHALILTVVAGIAATSYLRPEADLDALSIERIANEPSALARHYAGDDYLEPEFLPPPAATEEPTRRQLLEHVVAPGETISGLATQYGVTMNTIIWANGLANADNIGTGQRLVVPPVSGILYTVRPGETLDDVAFRFSTSSDALLAYNDVPRDGELSPGLRVAVPGARIEDLDRAVVASRAVTTGGDGLERRGIVDRHGNLEALKPGPIRVNVPFDVPATEPPAGIAVENAQSPAPVTPPPIVAGPSIPRPSTYVVVGGDTLRGVAERFSVSLASLILANDLAANTETINVGQNLVVPPPNSFVHKVNEGETVSLIAEKYGVPSLAIVESNKLAEPYIIAPEQILVVPGGDVAIEEVVRPPPPPEPPPGIQYAVEAGDSVRAIAETHGIDTAEVIRVNGLDEPFILTPGQTLFLPGAQVVARKAVVQAAPAPVAQRTMATSGPSRAQAPPAPAPAPVVTKPKPVAKPAVVAAAAPKSIAPTGGAWNVVNVASRFLGYRYTWGGHAPSTGFDCTGYTWYVYKQAGLNIPMHDLWGQLQAGPRVSRANLQAGDLVFFVNTYKAGLSHSGIYIGGGRFIHAQSERVGVAVTSLNDPYWAPRYYGASRPW